MTVASENSRNPPESNVHHPRNRDAYRIHTQQQRHASRRDTPADAAVKSLLTSQGENLN